MKKDLLTIADMTAEEIGQLFELTEKLKLYYIHNRAVCPDKIIFALGDMGRTQNLQDYPLALLGRPRYNNARINYRLGGYYYERRIRP